MSLIVLVISLSVQGLIVGAFARLALPGRDPLTIPQTIGLGVAGTLLAGLVVALVSGGRGAPTFLAALFFSVLVLYVVRRRRGGSLTEPGRAGGRRA